MADDVIKLLPDSVANQIAAGEVIQRPASVIKELVENAIDAGATSVQIVLKDAGKTLIQVVDNGCGMSTTDARLAFERHATSKIRKADDLFSLHTMGFRGEALPSIAAVAEVELRSMRPGDSMGTALVIKASEFVSQEPCLCSQGTNIMVKHLFYNFVARRRFLKKDVQEMTHIMHEFERLALVNTEIEFSLTHNGQLVHQLPRAPLKKRIGSLFGKTVEQGIIPIETSTGVVRISGFVGLPDAARRRGALQFFFVNGRNMRHSYFHRAVLNCYKDLISADSQPNYFINFEVDASRIDVNIHPQKHEIKFEDEQLVYQILTASIKEALGKFNVGPAIDFNASDVPDIPPCVNGADIPLSPVSDDFDPGYTPFGDTAQPPQQDPSDVLARSFLSAPVELPEQGRLFTAGSLYQSGGRESGLNRRGASTPSALNQKWEKLYDAFLNPTDTEVPADTESPVAEAPAEKDAETTEGKDGMSLAQLAEGHGFSQKFIQFKGRYIISDSKSGLMFIDQHRAHLLVIYNSLLDTFSRGSLPSQYLLIEERIELDATASAIATDKHESLEAAGFKAERLDMMANTWILKAIPSRLHPSDAVETFRSVIADIAEDTCEDGNPIPWQRRVALSLARASAMRGANRMTDEEIEQLVTELFRLAAPGYTPDGLPVIRIMPSEAVTRLFQR